MFSILSRAREKDISGQIGQPIEKVRKLMKLRQQLYHSSIWSVSCLQENFYSFQTRNTKHSYSYWYFPKRGYYLKDLIGEYGYIIYWFSLHFCQNVGNVSKISQNWRFWQNLLIFPTFPPIWRNVGKISKICNLI